MAGVVGATIRVLWRRIDLYDCFMISWRVVHCDKQMARGLAMPRPARGSLFLFSHGSIDLQSTPVLLSMNVRRGEWDRGRDVECQWMGASATLGLKRLSDEVLSSSFDTSDDAHGDCIRSMSWTVVVYYWRQEACDPERANWLRKQSTLGIVELGWKENWGRTSVVLQ
jgi:hypothetical protein